MPQPESRSEANVLSFARLASGIPTVPFRLTLSFKSDFAGGLFGYFGLLAFPFGLTLSFKSDFAGGLFGYFGLLAFPFGNQGYLFVSLLLGLADFVGQLGCFAFRNASLPRNRDRPPRSLPFGEF
jgi:hypothetical protein